MNLILCEPEDIASGLVVLHGERAEHVRCVHRACVGDELRVGVVNGAMGKARVQLVARRHVELRIEAPLTLAPCPAHPLALAVSMCRPPSLHKVLAHATSMGVKSFAIFHCRRVEKSFWDSHALAPDQIEATLRLGLEQARDTVLPTISWHRHFRPFAEDVLAPLAKTQALWMGEPHTSERRFAGAQEPLVPGTLVVGPEGGFVPFEQQKLQEVGARPISLGPRILRVEVAVTALLAAYEQERSVRGA